MTRRHLLILCILWGLNLGSCGAGPENSDPILEAEPDGTPTLVIPTPTGESDTGAPTILQIWFAEELNPADGSPAGDLLSTRLDEFEQRHPGLRISIRVKGSDGPGSIMAALDAAMDAAPLALPDIVAIPHTELVSSADEDLVFPLDELLSDPDDRDWYGYAQQMGQVNSVSYGIPFSGDALVLAYRKDIVEQAPTTWEEVLLTDGPLGFPAADGQALFPLTLYQSIGGELMGENGEVRITPASFGSVLRFFENAQNANVMPFWLTQLDNDASAWNEFAENRANSTVTWWTQYLSSENPEHAAVPLPTQSGEPYTSARGWVFALTAPNENQHAISVELMEFLTEAEFMAGWTAAAGVLPPRPSALAAWPAGQTAALASQISPAAQLVPGEKILETLGPLFSDATVAVLKQESNAESAAQEAIEALGTD